MHYTPDGWLQLTPPRLCSCPPPGFSLSPSPSLLSLVLQSVSLSFHRFSLSPPCFSLIFSLLFSLSLSLSLCLYLILQIFFLSLSLSLSHSLSFLLSFLPLCV